MTTFIQPEIVTYTKKYCGDRQYHGVGKNKCKCSECMLGRFIGAVGRNDLACVENMLCKQPDLLDRRLVTKSFADSYGGELVLFTSHHMKEDTALMRAIAHKRILMFDHLLEMGCDPNVPVKGVDGIDMLPLMVAVKTYAPHFMITRLLGISDLSFRTERNQNIFHFMMDNTHQADSGEEDIFAILHRRLEAGDPIADVNAIDVTGMSPLLTAIKAGYSDYFITQLISFGADVFLHTREQLSTLSTRITAPMHSRLERLQKPEQIYAASCARDLGTTPDGNPLVWKRLPDELWRHMGSFL